MPVTVCEQPLRALGRVGSGTYVGIPTSFLYASYLTTLPAITASGRRLQLTAVLKGRTRRCLLKVSGNASKTVRRVRLLYSDKGKTTTQTMLDWMQGPLFNYTQGRPCALLLDSYSAHWTKKVRELAELLRVELIQVPRRMTSELQPLDVRFNGPMKVKRMAIWLRKRAANPLFSDSWQAATERAQLAYQAMSKSTAKRAWAVAGLVR